MQSGDEYGRGLVLSCKYEVGAGSFTFKFLHGWEDVVKAKVLRWDNGQVEEMEPWESYEYDIRSQTKFSVAYLYSF